MSIEISVPQLGESIVEATVGRWLHHEGDTVAQGEPVVELETEKVNMEVAAPATGVLRGIRFNEGDSVGIGVVLAELDAQSAATTAPETGNGVAKQIEQPSSPSTTDKNRATPLARRIAEEHGVDLNQLSGSGTGGRVTHEDVSAYLAHTSVRPDSTASSVDVSANAVSRLVEPLLQAAPQAMTSRREERQRMSRRRQTIARRLVEAQHTAAMLTTFNEVDMNAIIDIRKRRRDAFRERYGVGLGYMSFFTKAVVGALKAFPRLNAEIDGDEMVIKHYYDIGIAVGVAEGLVVPVLRDADRMTFADIERHIATLAEKARQNTLSLEDLRGGTFTITNGGTFGSLLSTPILNTPQVAILGMHKIEERPIALNGQVVIHPMMYVAVSYDHRIVDGNEAVSFLVRVKELLEDPERLMLEA